MFETSATLSIRTGLVDSIYSTGFVERSDGLRLDLNPAWIFFCEIQNREGALEIDKITQDKIIFPLMRDQIEIRWRLSRCSEILLRFLKDRLKLKVRFLISCIVLMSRIASAGGRAMILLGFLQDYLQLEKRNFASWKILWDSLKTRRIWGIRSRSASEDWIESARYLGCCRILLTSLEIAT